MRRAQRVQEHLRLLGSFLRFDRCHHTAHSHLLFQLLHHASSHDSKEPHATSLFCTTRPTATIAGANAASVSSATTTTAASS